MQFFTYRARLCAAVAAATLALVPMHAFAQTMSTAAPGAMASMAPMDCSQVHSMMSQAMKAPPPAMTGDVDHDTVAAMKMHATMAMQMAKIEASCGKDPKKKAAAAQMMTDSLELLDRIQRLSSPE